MKLVHTSSCALDAGLRRLASDRQRRHQRNNWRHASRRRRNSERDKTRAA